MANTPTPSPSAPAAPSATPNNTASQGQPQRAPGEGTRSIANKMVNSAQTPTPPKTPAPKAPEASAPQDHEAPQAPRRERVKFDGQEVEVELDELKRAYGLDKTAYKRMEEAARVRDEAIRHREMFENDPVNYMLRRFGPEKAREWMETFLVQQYEMESLTPEQRAIRERDEIINEYKREKQTEAQRKAAEKFETDKATHRQNFQKQIQEALTKSKVRVTPRALRDMASLIQKNRSLKLNLDSDQLAGEFVSEFKSDIQHFLQEQDGETILEMLGDVISNKVRKADLARIKAKSGLVPNMKVVETPRPTNSAKPEATKPLSVDEWRARLDKKTQG